MVNQSYKIDGACPRFGSILDKETSYEVVNDVFVGLWTDRGYSIMVNYLCTYLHTCNASDWVSPISTLYS